MNPAHRARGARVEIAQTDRYDLLVFCDPVTYGPPEFWGYYSAYDHVVLCQLFGSMMHLPDGWPYYTRDLRQWADSLGITEPLDQFVANEAEHHALADARWTKAAWEHLNAVGKSKLALMHS